MGRDLSSSLVVFLISLPLCMAIAIASGMPPEAGLITGIAGGLIAAPLGGSPFQISGPAAGLSVTVAAIVAQNSVVSLGASVALAGLLQYIGGTVGIAQWFRAVPPSVIRGMLSGIGVLIFASQFHVMLDDSSKGSGIANILSIPWAAYKAAPNHTHDDAAFIGIVTLITLLLWQKFIVKRIPGISSALIAVAVGSLVANSLKLPVHYVQIPQNIFSSLQLVSFPSTIEDLKIVIGNGVLIAFIASAETLLTAAAIDKMHSAKRTDFNRELRGQGIGNLICGLVCSLPMTGVMVRSGANIASGAQSRLSATLVGIWFLVFTALFTSLVSYIPIASLAALLVYMGYKLAEIHAWKEIKKFGRGELLVYVSTVLTIVSFDLLTGILAGIALSVAKLVYTFSNVDVKLERSGDVAHIWLKGSATFLRLPNITEVLDQVPADIELHIHLEDLAYIDHACLDAILSWDKQAKVEGGCLVIDWTTLTAAFRDRRRSVRETTATRALVSASVGSD